MGSLRSTSYNGEAQLDPPVSDVDKYRKELIKHYKDMGFTKKEAEIKAATGLEKVLYGWYRAPKTFEKRIAQIKGRNSSKARKLREEKEKKEAEATLKKLSKSDNKEREIDYSFINHLELNAADKRFVKERKESYFRDFDFNNSNDEMIVNKIIIDELALRALEKKRFENIESINDDLEKTIDTVQKRLKFNIDSLGISRKLRVEQDMNIEGNVASLSVHLDKKLAEIRNLNDEILREDIMEKLMKEVVGFSVEDLELVLAEMTFQQKHESYPEKNPIPEAELLEEEEAKAVEDMDFDFGSLK
jgi:hypothetical protein